MFLSSTRAIRIDKRLYERLADVAQQQGYSTIDEFVRHVLERACASSDDDLDAQRAEQQLRGLGYLE
jgi:hypothetical protein